MKKVSIVIPTYNEQDNIGLMIHSLQEMFHDRLSMYDYEILIIDNDSKDETRNIIREECKKDKKVKAIFNERNFGYLKSPFYGLLQSTGDCSVMLCADFQDPPELIPGFLKYWDEEGYKVVIGKKTKSDENALMYKVRSFYYKLIRRFSETEYIEQFTGFGLYDQSFVQIMRDLKEPSPMLRGIVAEFSGNTKVIEYVQPIRERGKSSSTFMKLYDTAMVSVTSYTKVGLRAATFVGFLTAFVSFAIGIFYLVYKLTHWLTFSAGMAPLVVGMFFVAGIQLCFLGIMGEYILSINERVMNRPLVVEKERINFDE